MIQQTLKSVKIEDALEPFDGSATSKFVSVEIQPAGVVLRGTFTASQRPSVVADFAETPDGKALTAFKSWIPAGTVEKYVWTWVSHDASQPALPWSGIEHQVSSKHRFLFKPQTSVVSPGAEMPPPRAPLPWEIYQMCLRSKERSIVRPRELQMSPAGRLVRLSNPIGWQLCRHGGMLCCWCRSGAQIPVRRESLKTRLRDISTFTLRLGQPRDEKLVLSFTLRTFNPPPRCQCWVGRYFGANIRIHRCQSCWCCREVPSNNPGRFWHESLAHSPGNCRCPLP